jgi:DNA mismatch endonuclease (patch repair protein)
MSMAEPRGILGPEVKKRHKTSSSMLWKPSPPLQNPVAISRTMVPWRAPMDRWTKAKRSAVMAAVKPKGNRSTEVALAQGFRRNGVTGWRRHRPVRASGRTIRPDFVFPEDRLVVFVDGCFWHQCPIHGTRPATRVSYWLPKLLANKARDRRITRMLRQQGWRVVRIWEHSVRRDTTNCVAKVCALLRTKRATYARRSKRAAPTPQRLLDPARPLAGA